MSIDERRLGFIKKAFGDDNLVDASLDLVVASSNTSSNRWFDKVTGLVIDFVKMEDYSEDIWALYISRDDGAGARIINVKRLPFTFEDDKALATYEVDYDSFVIRLEGLSRSDDKVRKDLSSSIIIECLQTFKGIDGFFLYCLKSMRACHVRNGPFAWMGNIADRVEFVVLSGNAAVEAV